MIVVLYAMDEEVVDLLKQMKQVTRRAAKWFSIIEGTLENTSISLVKIGAGKVLSSITTQALIDILNPKFLILCGISGALNTNYSRGDLVIGTSFIQHDMRTKALGFKVGEIPFTGIRELTAPADLLKNLKDFNLTDAQVHFGSIVSGDQFIDGDRGAQLREEFGADVVDMESAAVAFVAELNKIPLLVARTISDRADSNAAIDFTEFIERASKHVFLFVKRVARGGN